MGRISLLGLLALAACSPYACGGSADGEVHVLPEGYVGPVVILFDQRGAPPTARDARGWRVYEIPPSGVLRTRLDPNLGGFPGAPEYLADWGDGRGRVAVREHPMQVLDQARRETPRDTVVTYNRKRFLEPPDECIGDPGAPAAVPYQQYVVGPVAAMDSLHGALRDRLDALTPACP